MHKSRGSLLFHVSKVYFCTGNETIVLLTFAADRHICEHNLPATSVSNTFDVANLTRRFNATCNKHNLFYSIAHCTLEYLSTCIPQRALVNTERKLTVKWIQDLPPSSARWIVLFLFVCQLELPALSCYSQPVQNICKISIVVMLLFSN